MDLILYPDGGDPKAACYKFYNGTEELRFDKSKWLYTRVMPDGSLIPQNGVTNVCHIIDKSVVLMPWAVKQAMLKLKRLLMARKYVIPQGSDEQPLILFEAVLDEIIDSAKRADREILEAAAETGTAAHDWIENYIKSLLNDADDRRLELLAKLPIDERAANGCIAACDWMVRHTVRWIATERKIFSRLYGYAGTMDGLARVDSCDDKVCCPNEFKDRLTLVDWKTSNYLYVEYLFQTAAYEHAYQEELGEKIEDRWIIRLGKDDAEFDPWHVEGQELFQQDFQGFLNCLALYRKVEEIKDRVASVQEAKVAHKRAIEKAARDAAHQIECPVAKTYKGKKKKKGCNGTETVCQACQKIYEEEQCKS